MSLAPSHQRESTSKMNRKHLLGLMMCVALPCSAAGAPSEDDILAALSRCDATFFSTLKQQASRLSATAQYEITGEHARFSVPNRFGEETSTGPLQPTVKLGPFDAVAYFDELWTMPSGGRFVAWGFVLNANVDDVMKALRPTIWESQRVVQAGPAFVRSELWEHAKPDLGWQKVLTESGEPRPGTVERVLLVEPYERAPGQTRFGCSIQGAITREMAQALRPDLPMGPPTRE